MRSWLRKPLGAVLVAGAILATGGAITLPLVTSSGGGACNLNATTANFSTQLAATSPGQTLCLASGNYGTWAGATKTSPGVTIKPQSGATSEMTLAFDTIGSPAWLTIDGVTIHGGNISGPTHDVTFKNTPMPGYLQLNPGASPGANNACGNCPAMNNNNIVFDGIDATLADCPTGSCLGGEGRITIVFGAATPAGITIKGSKFHNNCADGVQITGNGNAGNGVNVGPGNEFFNLLQGSCAPHVDSVQFVDGCCADFRDNYFHDSTHGIVNYDATPSGVEITGNVMANIASDNIAVCSASGLLVEHNTTRGPGDNYNCVNHSNTPSTNTVWRNNIQQGPPLVQGASTYAVNNFNLCTSGTCAGANSLNGAPTFVGGASPTTRAGFALAAGSLGKAAASDGTDIGVNP